MTEEEKVCVVNKSLYMYSSDMYTQGASHIPMVLVYLHTQEILKVQEKEQVKRLSKHSLIIARAAYEAEREGVCIINYIMSLYDSIHSKQDLSFSIDQEAMIIEPLTVRSTRSYSILLLQLPVGSGMVPCS